MVRAGLFYLFSAPHAGTCDTEFLGSLSTMSKSWYQFKAIKISHGIAFVANLYSPKFF